MIRQFLKSQPPCTIDQLTQMALGFLGGDIALCNPPDEAIGFFQPFIQSQLQTLSATFPNEVTLTPITESGTPNDPRTQLHLIRSAARFSPFFVLLLLLAVALFAVRSIRDLFIWWGWPLLIAGVSGTVIALVASPIVGWVLQYVIQTQIAALIPPLLASSISEAASAVAGQMVSPVIWQGLVMAVIGGTMLVMGFLLRRATNQVS
jgi:hypothetical protein